MMYNPHGTIIDPSRVRFPLRPPDPRVTVDRTVNDGYYGRYMNLGIIVTEALEQDGRWWTHASVSRADRKLPTWYNIRKLKELAIGHERTAIIVLPPEAVSYTHLTLPTKRIV